MPPGGGTSCNNFPNLVPSSITTDTGCTVNASCVITLAAPGLGSLPAGDYWGTCFPGPSANGSPATCNCCNANNPPTAGPLPIDQGPLYITFTGICDGEWCEGSGISGGTGPDSVYAELPECRPVGPTLAPSLGPAP